MVTNAQHIKLIQESGGIVQSSLFVTKPGVIITKKSSLTPVAKKLFDIMNIDNTEDEASQHAEFNSRITYMSFKDEKSSSREYNDNMINKYGHLSVYNDEFITFLIAGCSVETELEFIAHNEASVARLTSSKTKAQDDPLYSIINFNTSIKDIQIQKKIILEQIKLKEKFSNQFENNEIKNINTFGSKAVSFTITMSVKDWHKTLIGRLSHSGVEIEMLGIMGTIAQLLKVQYPYLIKSVPEYYEMGNASKLK